MTCGPASLSSVAIPQHFIALQHASKAAWLHRSSSTCAADKTKAARTYTHTQALRLQTKQLCHTHGKCKWVGPCFQGMWASPPQAAPATSTPHDDEATQSGHPQHMNSSCTNLLHHTTRLQQQHEMSSVHQLLARLARMHYWVQRTSPQTPRQQQGGKHAASTAPPKSKQVQAEHSALPSRCSPSHRALADRRVPCLLGCAEGMLGPKLQHTTARLSIRHPSLPNGSQHSQHTTPRERHDRNACLLLHFLLVRWTTTA
jgi:hypothetical protein